MSTTLLDLVALLTVQLTAINGTAPYQTDAGLRVDRFVEHLSDDDPCPRLAIVLQEPPAKLRELVNRELVRMQAHIAVACTVVDTLNDGDPLAELDQVERDVLHALFNTDAQAALSPPLQQLEYLHSVPLPRVPGGTRASVDVVLRLQWEQTLTRS